MLRNVLSPDVGVGKLASSSVPNAEEATNIDKTVPVFVLGGRENALSITRNLGSQDITVRVSGPADCWGMNSRFCAQAHKIPAGVSHGEFWEELLLRNPNPAFDGSVLFSGSDTALEFMMLNYESLSKKYRLGAFNPDLTRDLLDKQKTLDLARKAGVGAPQYWQVDAETDIEQLREQVGFPVMVKPIHSHLFIPVMGRKLFIIENDFDDLVEKIRLCRDHDLEIMIVEMIPGPDSQLSSYYTYIDEQGEVRFDYTKRVIRRYPENRGLACHHASEWLPETAEAGRRFFTEIGFTGLGNVEFKRDLRDGQLKIIEANTRFTAAQELLLRSGAPIDLACYCYATGQTPPQIGNTKHDMRLWYGLRDTLAFLEMRRKGRLSLLQWISGISFQRNVSPLHSLGDPLPSLGAVMARFEKTFSKE